MISKEDYAAGDVPSAVNYNNAAKNANDAGGFRDNINAAETISAFRPVFLDDTSNTWKYSDANDTARLRFDGFSLEAGSAGNPMKVQLSGIVRGLSSLDAGKDYYVQDDGTIGTTPGTYVIVVGGAISATELSLKKVFDYQFNTVVAVASNTLQASSDAEKYANSGTVLLKSIRVNITGSFRIKYDYKDDGVGTNTTIRLYKNGSAIGTGKITDDSWQTESADFSAVAGDTLEVWREAGYEGRRCETRNFRIYFDKLVNLKNCTNITD